jgi:hypothetical protein
VFGSRVLFDGVMSEIYQDAIKSGIIFAEPIFAVLLLMDV